MASTDHTLIYHERQSGSLCARHALNALLQGPYVDELWLAGIAQELDAQEAALLGGRLGAEGSTNVDDSGNFSISVMRAGLSRLFPLTLSSEPKDVDAALANPNKFSAYLLNLEHHWFTLRRLPCEGGVQRWFNLNSLLKVPEIISDFFLSAFLAQMRAEGYVLFCVAGTLPTAPLTADMHLAPKNWKTVSGIMAAAANGKGAAAKAAAERKAAAARARQEAAGDPEFEAALRASMADAGFDEADMGGYGGGGSGGAARGRGRGGLMEADDEEAMLAAAMAASLADAPHAPSSSSSGSGSSSSAGGSGGGSAGPGRLPRIQSAEDSDMAAAIALSLGQDAASDAASAGGGGGSRAAVAVDGDDSVMVVPAAAPAARSPAAQESAAEAVVRLTASLPAEPADGAAAAAARVRLRLPAAWYPAATAIRPGAASAAMPAPPAARAVDRNFMATDPLTALFTWADAAWLSASINPEAPLLPAPPPPPPQQPGRGEDAEVQVVTQPFPQAEYQLMLPSRRLLNRADAATYVSAEAGASAYAPGTLGAAGLLPSAVLTLVPARA